jgi:energy-coupling factor transport system substrate-specific component
MSIRRIVILATMITIVVTLEQLLSMLPNIQLTIVLLMVFISVLNFPESLILVLVYTILDNVLGGFSIYFIPMLFAWSLFAIVVYFIRGKHRDLVIFSAIFPVIFSVALGVPAIIIQSMNPVGYFIADIPFTVIFIVNNIITVVWLYPVLQKTLVKAIGRKYENLHQKR